MTRKERIQAYQEWCYNFHLTNAGCGPVFMIVLIVLTGLMGCAVKYVPVETVRTERVEVLDSIFLETVKHDSVLVDKRGDTVFVEKWHTLYKDRWRDRWRDSVRVDSVQVPFPVERELSKWEQFCLDYGKVTTGGTVVCVFLIIAYLVRRIKKPKG